MTFFTSRNFNYCFTFTIAKDITAYSTPPPPQPVIQQLLKPSTSTVKEQSTHFDSENN